ncbi:MAG: acyl-CoA thioesterase [Saprospiraceae bacterium]|jgi:acyl-CoA thioester hydrolase|nr:acyl-CoA thioesterase [Candidatus Defluviibacterium haderslevense]MBK7244798.1 acyl-CoA thioesterase [Candidatus Defluviibacterium haderslevense]MCI1267646.1 acyl-CoA thioesterase [Saprospiraceae bacterium]
MFTHTTQVRVRYGETDKMGFVYYGYYSLYYEIGRVEALRSLGLDYKSMEDQMHIFMPVVSLNVRYLRPAHYDDLLTLETSIVKWPNTSIQFDTKILNEKGDWLNQGQVVLCFLDIASRKRVEMPELLIQKLSPYFEK